MDDTENTIKVGDYVEINTPDDLDWHKRTCKVVQINGENCLVQLDDVGRKLVVAPVGDKNSPVKIDDTSGDLMVQMQNLKLLESDISLIEYFIGQGGGYGGQAGGSIAATGWAGTYSSPQTSNRLNLHPDTGVTSYMQGNTIVRNALPDTILPQDLEGTPYDPDEIRLGIRAEMKKQEFPDKEKAKQTVLNNLAKNRKFYSDLLQYINSDKGSLMENELKMGIEVEKEHTSDVALATKIAMDHLKEDPKYYTKLKAAGLDDSGCGDSSPDVAGMEIDPSTLKGIVVKIPNQPMDVSAIKVDGGAQKPLSSSGLGANGAPKPLSSTEIESPDPKKIGPNTVATTKTPVMTTSADPLDHFGSQIQKALSGRVDSIFESIGVDSNLATLKKFIEENPKYKEKIIKVMDDAGLKSMDDDFKINYFLQSQYENEGGFSGKVDPLTRIKNVKAIISQL
jgi:hypothetical protein